MSTSSINSLLSSLNPSTNESLAELLGESSTSSSTSSSQNSAIQDAVNAILNSATNTSGSGIDVTSTVDAILQIDAQPEVNLQNQVTALGTQTSALQSIETDLASLQTAVQALSDPTGAFSAVSVNSSNNDVVSATAANGAAAGSHTITVDSLATTSAEYSAPQTSSTSALPTGTLNIQVGSNTAVPITVGTAGSTDNLSDLATYINQQNMGVTASVITDTSGARLSLVSQTSGTAGALTITDNTGTTGSDGMGFTPATDAQGNPLGTNASLTVDGVPVTSGSNTVTGVIPGVTLTLSGASSTPVTLAVQPDLTQVSTAINNFVTAYNQVMTDINTQNTYSGSGTPPPLLGDPSLDLLQSQLLNGITTSITGNNGLVNLQSIGIQLQENGTLTVASSASPDSMSLNDALTNDFSSVQNLFQSSSSPGVAQALNTALTAITDPTNGPLNLDMSGITSQVSDLNTQISNFQYQLQQTQAQLTLEYDTINTTLEQLPETLASINSQLNSLNPPNTSNG
ncbi:MAG: flagellar filament capping protein FliD [Terriglobia bacterium]